MSAEAEGGPVRRLGDWLDARLGWRELARRHGRGFRVPAESGSMLSLGGILLFALVLQIATGTLLLFYFVPDPERAFESVQALMRDVPFGWAVRLVHAHGANLIVAIAFLHLVRTALRADYKSPRELVWITGCALFLLVLAAALTGYILPWSQMSYWATTVVSATIEYLPFVGSDLVRIVRGGEFVGPPTFRRAFAAHVALIPAAIALLVMLHLALVRRAGLAARPRRGQAEASPRLVPFYPRIALRYALGVTGFLVLLFGLVVFAPNLFFPPQSFLPADPFDTPPNVKPEWYFLWAYQLPRLIAERWALALQGIAVVLLFGLPFLDRGPLRHPLDRPLITAGIVLAIAILVGLSVLGHRA